MSLTLVDEVREFAEQVSVTGCNGCSARVGWMGQIGILILEFPNTIKRLVNNFDLWFGKFKKVEIFSLRLQPVRCRTKLSSTLCTGRENAKAQPLHKAEQLSSCRL